MKVKTPSKLEKILAAGHLAVTSECGPPRGTDMEVIVEKANLIKDHVDAINITTTNIRHPNVQSGGLHTFKTHGARTGIANGNPR